MTSAYLRAPADSTEHRRAGVDRAEWYAFWDEIDRIAGQSSLFSTVCSLIEDRRENFASEKEGLRYKIKEPGCLVLFDERKLPNLKLRELSSRHGLTAVVLDRPTDKCDSLNAE